MADSHYGSEILIKKISGRSKQGESSRYTQIVDDLQSLTLSGKYMSLTLRKLYVNVPIQSSSKFNVRSFTLLKVVFHNIWDYRLSTFTDIKMIDSEGFQHDGKGCHFYEFTQVILPNKKKIDVNFPWPELVLEDHCKTEGWVWFDELANGVVPHRFIFIFNVFEPGEISGWVKDYETLEFIINSHDFGTIKSFTK